MIVTLQGEVISVNSGKITLQIGMVGLRVFVPQGLSNRIQSGETVFLHTHLVVREDDWSIYGFENETEREFFQLFLGVSGIGPKLALSILSTLSIDVIRRAVLSEQAEIFARVPGIGIKSAQRLLIHLQGKVGTFVEGAETGKLLDVDGEVIDALTSLGYSIIEAQRAVQTIPRDGPSEVEERLRIALQFFR